MLMINIIINNTIVIIAAAIAVTVTIFHYLSLIINMFITQIKLIEYKSDIIIIFIFFNIILHSNNSKCVSIA